jgi:hypothetical protein
MRTAVIVSTAHTPIDRAYRGTLSHNQSQTFGGSMGAAGLFAVA